MSAETESRSAPGDVLVRQYLLQSDGGAVRTFARWANYGGRVHVLLPAAIVLFWLSSVARRNWRVWCAVLIGSSLIQHAFKFLVGRSRPSGSSLGFPSGHTTAAATFAIVLVYIASREQLSRAQRVILDALGVSLMLAVGWARIMRHAHWPSDVLGGFLLGIGCAAAAAPGSARPATPGSMPPRPRRPRRRAAAHAARHSPGRDPAGRPRTLSRRAGAPCPSQS